MGELKTAFALIGGTIFLVYLGWIVNEYFAKPLANIRDTLEEIRKILEKR